MKEDMNEIIENMMEQIRTMNEEELKKLLHFLDKMANQKEQGQKKDGN